MELKNLSKPLAIQDIDFRVQSINKGGYAYYISLQRCQSRYKKT